MPRLNLQQRLAKYKADYEERIRKRQEEADRRARERLQKQQDKTRPPMSRPSQPAQKTVQKAGFEQAGAGLTKEQRFERIRMLAQGKIEPMGKGAAQSPPSRPDIIKLLEEAKNKAHLAVNAALETGNAGVIASARAAHRRALLEYDKAMRAAHSPKMPPQNLPAIAAILQNEITRRQVGAPTEAELAKQPTRERLAPARRTLGISYKAGKRQLVYEPEFMASLHLMTDVFSKTGSTRLNNELQGKLGAEGVVELLNRMTAGMPRPMNMKELKENREEAIKVLRENADAIWPALWYGSGFHTEEITQKYDKITGEMKSHRAVKIDTRPIFSSISARKRLLSKFAGEEEMDKLVQHLTRSAKFPGWLAVEGHAKDISGLATTRLHRLSAKEVMKTLGPQLQKTAAAMKAQHDKRITEIEEKMTARRATEHARETQRIIVEGKGALLRAGIEGGRGSVRPGEIIQKEPKQEVWRFAMHGQSVTFRRAGRAERVFRRMFKLTPGLFGVMSPNNEPFVVEGDAIRKPRNKEEEELVLEKSRNPEYARFLKH